MCVCIYIYIYIYIYLSDVEISTIATVIVNLLTEIEMVETSGTIFSLLVYLYFRGVAI